MVDALDNPLSELQLKFAQFVLGLARSWEIPPVADRALENGLYSPSLAELAALREPIISDVASLFERTLAELGLPLPSRSAAAWLVARHCMESIVTEDQRPREALRMLKDVCDSAVDVLPDQKHVGDGLDLGSLIGIYWSYTEPNENYYEPEHRLVTNEHERQSLLDAHARRDAVEWFKRHPRP